MKTKKHLGVSAILGKIYFGRINKTGDSWLSKEEVDKNDLIQTIFDWVKHESEGTNVVGITKTGKPYADIIVKYHDTTDDHQLREQMLDPNVWDSFFEEYGKDLNFYFSAVPGLANMSASQIEYELMAFDKEYGTAAKLRGLVAEIPCKESPEHVNYDRMDGAATEAVGTLTGEGNDQ